LVSCSLQKQAVESNEATPGEVFGGDGFGGFRDGDGGREVLSGGGQRRHRSPLDIRSAIPP
jgi:hypothetical protein